MRLLQKTNRVYFLYATCLLLIAGILLYIIITSLVKAELKEKLSLNIDRIENEIANGKTITSIPPVVEVYILSENVEMEPTAKDTMIHDQQSGDEDMFAQVTSIKRIGDKNYKIIVRQVILEPHDYYNSISLALFFVFLLLLAGLYLINLRTSKIIWQPFYTNLEKIKSFSLQQNNKIELQQSDITEFNELNAAIEKLTEKIITDYQSLKSFTENASHEMQTPVTIIKNKMEMLMQHPELTELQHAQIKSTYDAANRLSKLNKSLLLLTQIENRQFHNMESIDLSQEIEKLLEFYADTISEKGIHIKKNITAKITLFANRSLTEICFSNIVFNAIKHNVQNGEIHIQLNKNSCLISNSGKPLQVEPAKLFERFAKNEPSSDSTGLGLSIIQKICETNGWQINYTYADGLHSFLLTF